jgi:hypothetical protein
LVIRRLEASLKEAEVERDVQAAAVVELGDRLELALTTAAALATAAAASSSSSSSGSGVDRLSNAGTSGPAKDAIAHTAGDDADREVNDDASSEAARINAALLARVEANHATLAALLGQLVASSTSGGGIGGAGAGSSVGGGGGGAAATLVQGYREDLSPYSEFQGNTANPVDLVNPLSGTTAVGDHGDGSDGGTSGGGGGSGGGEGGNGSGGGGSGWSAPAAAAAAATTAATGAEAVAATVAAKTAALEERICQLTKALEDATCDKLAALEAAAAAEAVVGGRVGHSHTSSDAAASDIIPSHLSALFSLDCA